MDKPSKKVKKATRVRERENEQPAAGRYWTQWIKPKDAALISQMLKPSNFVIKNHGPDAIMLVAEQGDLMDLPAGAVRATFVHGVVRVENRGEKPVLIEFDILPAHFK